MDAIVQTHEVWNSRISTGGSTAGWRACLAHHPPPAVSGRRLKIKYMTQIKTRPPGFVLSCSRPDALPESYMRYLTNSAARGFRPAGRADPHVRCGRSRKPVCRPGQESKR